MPSQVFLIQVAMFRELVNVRYHRRRFKDIPLFRTSQWFWFYACMLFSYGATLSKPSRMHMIKSELLLALLPYYEFATVIIYSALLVGTVLSFKSGMYKYQSALPPIPNPKPLPHIGGDLRRRSHGRSP